MVLLYGARDRVAAGQESNLPDPVCLMRREPSVPHFEYFAKNNPPYSIDFNADKNYQQNFPL
jgi:hypothetical protein